MTYLARVLDVEDGSRLTSIGLRPLAQTATQRHGSIYMHVVEPADGADSSVAADAAATFMPAALATLEGTSPDGGTWFATFQLAVDDRDWLRTRRLADAALRRALALTAVDDRTVRGRQLSAAALRDAYDGAGDVDNWSLVHLLTGLFLELANHDLAEVVTEVNRESGSVQSPERRQRSLHRLLGTWAIDLGGSTS